jgi:hypothetical protein
LKNSLETIVLTDIKNIDFVKEAKMKIRIIILLVVLVIVITMSFYSCSFKSHRFNYYRTVTLNGWYEIVGLTPLKDNIGKKSTCYHFIYDDKHRLVEVESLKNGKLSDTSEFGDEVAKSDY